MFPKVGYQTIIGWSLGLKVESYMANFTSELGCLCSLASYFLVPRLLMGWLCIYLYPFFNCPVWNIYIYIYTFKLLGNSRSTYLIGKMKFELLFHGPLAKYVENHHCFKLLFPRWKAGFFLPSVKGWYSPDKPNHSVSVFFRVTPGDQLILKWTFSQ